MNSQTELTPRCWFQEAARWYVEKHQACPWCRGRHQVYKSQRGSRLEYYCSACDFCASHDQESGDYFAAPGQTNEATVEH